MSVNEYVVGSTVILSVAFTNASKAPADPTTVELKVTSPDGVEAVLTSFTHTGGTGVYETAIVADQRGDYRYRFEAAGALVAISEGVFTTWSSYEDVA